MADREGLLWAAAIQLSSQEDLAANLAAAEAWTARAVARGARFVLWPENFAFMGPEDEKRRIAERLDGEGPILSALRAAARTHGITVVGGGMPEASDDPARPFNTCVVIGPDGDVRARYRKIHLFDVEVGDGQVYRESASTSAGDEPVVVDVDGHRVGLSVCYDLRFPELYRALIDRGAEVIVVPAAFTLATGKDHWAPLLRARAIESQAWVVAAAQHGEHPRGRRTFGKSCVIDPWGDVVAQASEGPGLALAPLDAAVTRSVRARLPSLAHRRLR